MKVLQLNCIILKKIGALYDNGDKRLKQIVIQYSLILFLILLVIPTLAYFVKNVSDVAKATDALYIAGIIGMTTTKFICFLRSKEQLHLILDELQQIIDSSE